MYSKEETSDRVISLVESDEVVSSLEEAYEKAQSIVEPQKEEVWTVHGWSEMLKKMGEMLSGAKKSAAVLTTEKGFLMFYRAYSRLLDKLVEKGVNVQIATPINSHNGSLARELNYVCKVKDVKVDSSLLYLCVDDQACFVAKLGLEPEESRGAICYSANLCDLFSLLLPRTDE